MTAVGILILVVAASVYAEGMQISRGEPDLLGQRSIGLGIAAFGLVGALLLYRRPGHRLGWLLAGIGILALLGGSANEYVLAVTRAGGSASDLVAWLVWLSNWFWWPVVGGVFVFLPLLFPDGRPPTPRWRWVLIIGMLGILGLVMASALQERYTATILGEIPSIENPLGIEGLTAAEEGVLYEAPAWILLAAFVGAVASMTVRFRRSVGVERLQLKWFSYAVGLMLAWTLLGEVLWESVLGHDDLLGGSVFPFGLLLTLIPITIAVAILRYRLYAIDRIVSRTVSYGLLVGLLAFVYVGGVFVVGSVLPEAQTDLGVAASTLAVAVLFTPLRQRIQRAVDRRFNRSRYNAERVIEEFTRGLRNQVDLGEVSSGLRRVLDRTIQPVTTQIWLRSQP
ncbi:MAG TPA: hypothetical protein VFT54_05805 [Acidimicrobiia bacterium]|nr:hypothetical protein [Acidimicrobiia bacterium]